MVLFLNTFSNILWKKPTYMTVIKNVKISLILGENLTYDSHKGLFFNFLFEKSLRYGRHETGYRIFEFLK